MSASEARLPRPTVLFGPFAEKKSNGQRPGSLGSGRTGKDDPLRTSDSAKTLSVSSVDELDTRSLVVQSSHSSYHTTDGSHDQTAILSETSTWSMVISGCARGGLRSGVGVGFDSASTMLGQPKNGDARRKSGSSSKLRPLRRPHSNDRQHSFDRIRGARGWCDPLFGGPLPARTVATHARPPHASCSSRHCASTTVLGFLSSCPVHDLQLLTCSSSAEEHEHRRRAACLMSSTLTETVTSKEL